MKEFAPYEKPVTFKIDESTIVEIPNFRACTSLYKKCFFADKITEDGKHIRRMFTIKEKDGKEELCVLANIPEEVRIISSDHYYPGGMMDNSNNIVIHTDFDSYAFNPSSAFFESPSDTVTTSVELAYEPTNIIIDGLKRNEELNKHLNRLCDDVVFYKNSEGHDVIVLDIGDPLKVEPIDVIPGTIMTVNKVIYCLGKVLSKVRNREDIPIEEEEGVYEDRYRLIAIDPTNEEPVLAYHFPFYSPQNLKMLSEDKAILEVVSGEETVVNEEGEKVVKPNIKEVLLSFITRPPQLSACYDIITLGEESLHYSKKVKVGEDEVLLSGNLENDGAISYSIMMYTGEVKVPEDNDSNGLSIKMFSDDTIGAQFQSFNLIPSEEIDNSESFDDIPFDDKDVSDNLYGFSFTKKCNGYKYTYSGTARIDGTLVGGSYITLCVQNDYPFLLTTLTNGKKYPGLGCTILRAKECIKEGKEGLKEINNVVYPPKTEPLMQVLTDKHGE